MFDGYEDGPSIKDNTHQRRGNNIHPIVNFTGETEFSGKKEEFLSRDLNKQRLIQLISDALKERHCTVVNSLGDADVDIVQAEVRSSLLHTSTLIGEDTDLLVLLLYYAQSDSKRRFVPLMSTMNVAPDSLLKVIHCNCTTACKTLRCSCRKYGLPCTIVCGPCQLQECDNPHIKFLPEDSEDDDE